MTAIDRYRDLYEHEKACNAKLLRGLDSVPADRRSDARFARALAIAGHMVAGRQNWLDRLQGRGREQMDWWPQTGDPATLCARLAALEPAWTQYLGSLKEEDLDAAFDFPTHAGGRFGFKKGVLLEQMAGHGIYHRGQVALLVDQLGGETDETDYVQWVLGS